MAQSFRSILGVSPSKPSIASSVLILIDVQNEYDHGHLKIKDFSTSVAAIAALLKRYRDAGSDVIHVVHNAPAGAPVFTPGTELAEEFPVVEAKINEAVVLKTKPISFTGTNLEELIARTGKRQLVLVGYMAHVCVSGTTRVAYEKGYDVTVVRDCIGDRDIPGATAEDVVRVVLAELGDAFATVLDSSEILG